MSVFVFRNNTIERFFPKDYVFSGYDDISSFPTEAESYVWFYQAPIGHSRSASVEEIQGINKSLTLYLRR